MPHADQNPTRARDIAIARAQGILQGLMHAKGVDRAELARRMGRSEHDVRLMFTDGANHLTLTGLAEAAFQLGVELEMTLRPMVVET